MRKLNDRITWHPKRCASRCIRIQKLSLELQINEVKTFAISCALVLTTPLSLTAGEHIYCKSPDGEFALRETFAELNPSHGDAAIIETGTRKVAVQLNINTLVEEEF